MLHVKLKGMEHRAPCKHIFCTYTHSRPLGAGSKGQPFLFQRSHVAYQKGMEHNAPRKHIFCAYTHHLPLGSDQNVKAFFLKVIMLHIKLKGMERRAPWKSIYCPYTLAPWGLVERSNHFHECGHVAYQIKGKEVKTNIEAKSLTVHISLTLGLVEITDTKIVQISICVFYLTKL